MLIDFSPVFQNKLQLSAFAQPFTTADLIAATHASIDLLRSFIDALTDAHMVFDPVDPLADDPYAKEGEERIGWSLAHLVVHVTASAEESAAIASILARGIPYGKEPRLRYETEWHTVTTHAQAVQRIEESRRIRLGYLAAWPDQPHYETQQIISERAHALWGDIDAKARYLLGLYHEWQHYDQFRDVRAQALAAIPLIGTSDAEATVEAPSVQAKAG